MGSNTQMGSSLGASTLIMAILACVLIAAVLMGVILRKRRKDVQLVDRREPGQYGPSNMRSHTSRDVGVVGDVGDHVLSSDELPTQTVFVEESAFSRRYASLVSNNNADDFI